MTTRRRGSQPDSLELLLDTVCNTFGGVLFIAILVVILLQTTGHQETAAQPAPPPKHELEEMRFRLESHRAEIASLRRVRDDQESLLDQFTTDESKQRLTDRNELRAAGERLQDELRELIESNAETAIEIEAIRQRVARAEVRLERLRDEVARLESALERHERERRQSLRMPLARAPSTREIPIIVRFGRMYVWHEYDRNGLRQGLNRDEFVIVEEESGGLVTLPNPTAGVSLDGTTASAEAIRRRLRAFDPRRHHLATAVRPDSYGHFQHLRDAMIDHGFQYRVMPMSEGESLFDRGGSGGLVQ